MAMSRKHFEAVARILASNADPYENGEDGYDVGRRHARDDTAHDLADYLATENPHFDRQRFLKAAGVS